MSIKSFKRSSVKNLNHYRSFVAGNPPFRLELYSFTTFTFTNADATGRTGPTYSALTSAYSSASWTANTAFFNATDGIQLWTVPATATYEIQVTGASGGTSFGPRAGGLAAIMTANFSLTEGQKLKILVGQMGLGGNTSNSCGSDGGGGGGSFVALEAGNSPLIVAGGGGGAGNNQINRDLDRKNAANSTNGNKASGNNGGNGGTAGGGGSIQTNSCVSGGGGGGGFSGSGSAGGQSFLAGGQGGTGGFAGGFGGGGGAGVNYAAGGGGGWSGGGGGGLDTCSCNDMGDGGAGGSYSLNTYTFARATVPGHGSVRITKL
jgi:hypothetical protein